MATPVRHPAAPFQAPTSGSIDERLSLIAAELNKEANAGIAGPSYPFLGPIRGHGLRPPRLGPGSGADRVAAVAAQFHQAASWSIGQWVRAAAAASSRPPRRPARRFLSG